MCSPEQIQTAFDALAEGGDGTVSYVDLVKKVRELYPQIPFQDIVYQFKALDISGDNKLTQKEIDEATDPNRLENQLMDTFTSIDKDDSGKIGVDEFFKWLKENGKEELCTDKVAQVFNEVGGSDKMVSWEEFRDQWCGQSS